MKIIQYKFVEYIPDEIEDEVLYISIEFHTAVHKCFCGCGNEVITPISPNGWELRYNGKSVTLEPSIGNWSFHCQSHYWIVEGKVILAPKWSKKEVDFGRNKDKKRKYFGKQKLIKFFSFKF